MKFQQKSKGTHVKGKMISCLLFTFYFFPFSPLTAHEVNAAPRGSLRENVDPIQSSVLIAQSSNCPEADVEKLTAKLLRDLPSYANRINQSARRLNRTADVYSYVLVAGRPEFAPLTLGPGEYNPADSTVGSQQPQQVFITTLERQYTDEKAVELQQYHWVFLTQTSSGWRLAMMFSRTGTYPAEQPPTPPRDSSDGIIAQAIRTWLRDCQARSVRREF